MILCDREIRELAAGGMITPFVDSQVRDDVISYGLSSFGYDARVDRQWKVFYELAFPNDEWLEESIIDPKNFNKELCEEIEADYCIIPPHGFVLARTIERFKIPRNVLAICMGKSTYARCGIICQTTPLEPEWEGTVTLEFSNTTSLPAKIYAGEGACQFIFLRGEDCSVSYTDRQGKYMGQTDVTLPKI